MKRLKTVNKWGIYQNSKRETEEYGFSITVLTPSNMECVADSGNIFTPSDSDMEFDTVAAAEHWIKHYDD